jgi:hypothetical protein
MRTPVDAARELAQGLFFSRGPPGRARLVTSYQVALSGRVPGSAVATTSRRAPSGPHQPSLAWIALRRWWTAWSKAPPPPQLQALISSVAAGCGLHLYIPN